MAELSPAERRSLARRAGVAIRLALEGAQAEELEAYLGSLDEASLTKLGGAASAIEDTAGYLLGLAHR